MIYRIWDKQDKLYLEKNEDGFYEANHKYLGGTIFINADGVPFFTENDYEQHPFINLSDRLVVEWGVTQDNADDKDSSLYEGDILVCNGDTEYPEPIDDIEDVIYKLLEGCTFEVVGNIHGVSSD